MRQRVLCSLSWLVVTGGMAAVSAAAPSVPETIYQSLGAFELRPQAEKPEWAKIAEPPLFAFAWMSDLHLDPRRLERTRLAFQYIDTQLKAAFVAFTGDDNGWVGPSDQNASAPADVRRQLFLKQFLKNHLKTPAVVIPGDDWPEAFEKVFGSFQFSFDYGGMHFLFTSLDRCTFGVEGRAVFEESTLDWMRRDLQRNHNRPTLFFMHEMILPPSFLDAAKTRALLESNPNVIGALCGHLHLDVEFGRGPVRYLLCPSLGVNPRHGFKFLKVYRDRILIETIEYDEPNARFEPVNRWQKIDIPEPLRASLHSPTGSRFVRENYTEIPPHPRQSDPELMKRTQELVNALMQFAGDFLTVGARGRVNGR